VVGWPIGAACSQCYQRTRTVGTCPTCGQTHPLVGLDDSGKQICARCVGLDHDYQCRRCHRTGLFAADGLCFECLAEARANRLLAGPGRTLPRHAQPLVPARLSAGTGGSRLTVAGTRQDHRHTAHQNRGDG